MDNVKIQTDSLEVVMAIQESFKRGFNTALIRKILQLLSQVSHWNIFHIPREVNHEADRITKITHSGSQDLWKFERPPFGELI